MCGGGGSSTPVDTPGPPAPLPDPRASASQAAADEAARRAVMPTILSTTDEAKKSGTVLGG